MTDLLPLAARVEALAGPDRAVDAEIAAAVRWIPQNAPSWLKRWGGPIVAFPEFIHPGQVVALHNNGQRGVNWTSPEFTGSLDAVVSVAPPGWIWDVTSTGTAWVMASDGEQFFGKATAPSRALLAAALRARATGGECG